MCLDAMKLNTNIIEAPTYNKFPIQVHINLCVYLRYSIELLSSFFIVNDNECLLMVKKIMHFDSMTRRLNALIAARGGTTKY